MTWLLHIVEDGSSRVWRLVLEGRGIRAIPVFIYSTTEGVFLRPERMLFVYCFNVFGWWVARLLLTSYPRFCLRSGVRRVLRLPPQTKHQLSKDTHGNYGSSRVFQACLHSVHVALMDEQQPSTRGTDQHLDHPDLNLSL